MDAKDFGQLLNDHSEMLDDAKKFAAILRDVYPGEKGNVNLMITAYEAGVIPMLRGSHLDGLLITRITTLLTDDYYIAEEKARWTAELWCDAFGFMVTGKLPEREPSSAAQAKPAGQPVYPTPAPPSRADVFAEPIQETDPKCFEVEQIDSECIIKKYIGPKTRKVVIPARISGKLVTEIGDSAFKDCTYLTSVSIPYGITIIGKGAFENCTGLTNMEIPDSVTAMGEEAFRGCTGLTSVTIPDSGMGIREYTFYGCTGLSNVTIPSSVTAIGDLAFWNCPGITDVTILGDTTGFSNRAFNYINRTLVFHAPAGSFAEKFAKTNSYWVGFQTI